MFTDMVKKKSVPWGNTSMCYTDKRNF